MMPRPALIAIVGPTASGKSALAVELAHRLGGAQAAEIVSVDAYALYRDLDIGTAKPSVCERRGIKHHQIDVLDFSDDAVVASYQKHARADIDAIYARGRQPIAVGGSVLYLSALLDEMQFQPSNAAVREKWMARLAQVGRHQLHRDLAEIDPEAAAIIAPENERRVVRALEVNELTGKPFVARLPKPTYHQPTITIGLKIDREIMWQRAKARTQEMFATGLIDEVRSLAERGFHRGLNAARAMGYSEVLRYLSGEISEEQARELTEIAHRKLVRRQQSWLKRDERIHWVNANDARCRELADRVQEILAGLTP